MPKLITKASHQHAQLLSDLGAETFLQAHKDSAPAHEIAAYVKKVYSIDAVANELNNPVNIYHLIKHEEAVAGFSKMEFSINHPDITLDRVTKMDQIYLLDSFHGLKLGAQLMRFNIDLSKSHGEKGMWLAVWTKNFKAISFYEKFGFSIVKESKFPLTATHLNPCYIMLLNYENVNPK
jgi:diamine N-acetyltransferase